MLQNKKKNIDEKFCSDCGEIIKIKAEICPKCGIRQFSPPSLVSNIFPSEKNRIIAALFAIFLGAFGVHKFYLGHVEMGVLYLAFFWSGIPTIIGFIEGLILLMMSENEFKTKYVNT